MFCIIIVPAMDLSGGIWIDMDFSHAWSLLRRVPSIFTTAIVMLRNNQHVDRLFYIF